MDALVASLPPAAAHAVTAAEVIVRSAQAGDEPAREELARRCLRLAYLYALHHTGNREDACDLAQDALLRFFAALDRFDSGRPLEPWLLSIVRHLVVDRSRRRRYRRTETLSEAYPDAAVEPVDGAPDPESAMARREMQVLTWRALGGLEARYREVVILRDYLDLDYQAIATILSVPRGTVMSRLHRARRRLLEKLRESMSPGVGGGS